jgi:very-short-patch-repair endonuclease/DNA polymerase III delta prime subunit
VFNRLYELQGRVEREGESVQLLLGQGILLWRRDDGDVRHPVVVQRLELSFDPYVPEFTVLETEQPVELLRPLLFADQPNAAQTIQHADEELAKADFDLLDSTQLEGPLRRLAAVLHSEGRFLHEAQASAVEYPRIYCDPVVYLSRRTQGFAAALDYILEDLRQRVEFPPGLLRISGIDPAVSDLLETTSRAAWEEPVDILFTKEANDEQFQIADRLARHNNVLVQGPPGTGKTHTIANLIGHLLAEGKRVLVTAHTSKALRVLRDKVAEPLQTLCVSVLDNETESRRQLEASVDAMVARLTADDPRQLDREAEVAHQERCRLVAELCRLQRALIEARQDEYREVVVAGASTSPSDAARFVASTSAQNSWIEGPIEPGVPAPLSEEEATELYSTNARIQPADETDLDRWRPLLGDVAGAKEFGLSVARWRDLEQSDKSTGSQFWGNCVYDTSEEELRAVQARVRESVDLLSKAPLWKLDAVAAGLPDRGEAAAPWTELIGRLDKLRKEARRALNVLLDYRCSFDGTLSQEQYRMHAQDVRSFLESGGKLTALRLVTRPAWRKFLSAVTVNDRQPTSAPEFLAIETAASLCEARSTLGTRWTNQITTRGGPKWGDFGDRPEEGAVLFIPQVRALVAWHKDAFSPLADALQKAGFKWDEFLNAQEIVPGEHAELRRLINAVVGVLPHVVAARTNLLNLKSLDRRFQNWRRALFSPDANALPASPVLDLRNAVDRKDYDAYDVAYRHLVALHGLVPIFERRSSLLKRIRPVAPRWAGAIQDRIDRHGHHEPPGSVADAWRWRQFAQELERRSRVSIPALQLQIEEVRHALRLTTTGLIELRSWSAQCKRVGLSERQALQGWKDIIRKIGRGTGQRAPGLRIEARRTLARARDAVPVWIMPLSRVAEAFDPRVARFDVVIVDEASQCDVMGLLALYLAKQAVVVGDHEQVSPLAIGQEISEVERLIDQHLPGIPNSRLYDGKTSLYDLARQSFGGMIRLLEHFRCMPEIIAFSNELSYNGTIKALRDPTSSGLLPAVIPYRMAGVRGKGKINEEEARTIVTLVQAALEQPEYRGKTFGVVSLLGEEQAVHVETIIRQRLSPAQLAISQFLCGTAAQFQGDERDVVFLSLVDSPGDAPLAKHEMDMYRQRFNVAGSRPKDQLWVVYSLDPRSDLKPGDLRRRLIEHAENPRALLETQLADGQTESEFERLVRHRLVNAGYRVKAQWPVGRYRIDLVVEGDGRRLAVECDGDRFHPLEKIAEDMARQAVLERLGWRFVRIRGSQFFRDPVAAMTPVFEKISALGIAPDAATTGSVASPPCDLLDRVKRRATEIAMEWDSRTQLSSLEVYMKGAMD